MKHITFLLSFSFVGLILFLASCSPSPTPTTSSGAWNKLLPFPGDPRANAVSFVINDIAYVGTGYNYQQNLRLKDFWKYDPSNELWIRVSDFPGSGRSRAVAFSANGKGYVGTGSSDGVTYLQDFYEFDPTVGQSGSWTKIADIPSARAGSIAFTVNARSFVGAGSLSNGSNSSDLWEYVAGTNTWTQRTGGIKHQGGFAMVIDDIAYIGGGTNNGIPVTEFYKFDVAQIDKNQNPWSQLSGLTGRDLNGNTVSQPTPRELASTFSISGKGYLVAGNNGNSFFSDTWQYDPSKDAWTKYFSFADNVPSKGLARQGALGFALTTSSGTYGYIATGGASGNGFDEVWKFIPTGIEPDNK
ncbi:MAG TPA: kelch repeat-containing protein [Cyclobacteriaceae bacterium]|nr:kelch repeat-containing protein [Cyclobacteriaceae bacterium]